MSESSQESGKSALQFLAKTDGKGKTRNICENECIRNFGEANKNKGHCCKIGMPVVEGEKYIFLNSNV